jgi:hypothetical protein
LRNILAANIPIILRKFAEYDAESQQKADYLLCRNKRISYFFPANGCGVTMSAKHRGFIGQFV